MYHSTQTNSNLLHISYVLNKINHQDIKILIIIILRFEPYILHLFRLKEISYDI